MYGGYRFSHFTRLAWLDQVARERRAVLFRRSHGDRAGFGLAFMLVHDVAECAPCPLPGGAA